MTTAKERSLSKGDIVVKLNWDEYINYIKELILIIQKSDIKLDAVYGIPRGGLIPATIISYQLNLRLLSDSDIFEGFLQRDDMVLIVDDICDTGETLLNNTTKDNFNTKTATLFKHKKSPVTPNFYVAENSVWIEFPYERGERDE